MSKTLNDALEGQERSRVDDGMKVYPMHIVCAWIGNSASIAAKHYLQVTDEDFDRAARPAGAA